MMRPIWSIHEPRYTADSTPSGMASIRLKANAAVASWMVAGSRSSTSVSAGICQR